MKSHVLSATQVFRGTLFIVLLSAFPFTTLAQLSERVTEICEVVHPIGWVKFKEGINIAGDRVFADHADNFGLGENDEMRLIRQWTDDLGFTHYRYQQYHAGVPIEYAMFTIHSYRGRAKSGNGRLAAYLTVKSRPYISKNKALDLAVRSLPNGMPRWIDEVAERNLQMIREDPKASYFSTPELTFTRRIVDENFTSDNVVLTYRIEVPTVKPVEYFLMYIDAFDGSVVRIDRQNTGCTSPTMASINTLYNGPQVIPVTLVGSDYVLESNCEGTPIKTLRVETPVGGSDPPTEYVVAHGDLDWTDDDDLDPFAQAHWSANVTFEYFRTQHGYKGYDDNGSTMKQLLGSTSRLDWFQPELCVAIPDPENFPTVFTDWATAVDVIAHEWTHAITCSLTGLAGWPTGEFGALYESFGDIFGSLAECFAKANYPNNSSFSCEEYTLGEEFFQPDFQRNMVNPHASSVPSPDTYCGTYWADATNHQRGGVQNRWFTLLVKQKDQYNSPWTGENNHCCRPEEYSVTPIGEEKVAAVVFRNLRTYLTPHSNYVDAMIGSIAAADDFINGETHEFTSADKDQIVEAWKAVGVYDNMVGFSVVRCSTMYTNTSEETSVQAIRDILATKCRDEGVEIKAGANIMFSAGNEITLRSDFVAETGCEFIARIVEPCTTFFSKSQASRQSTLGSTDRERYTVSQLANEPVLHLAPNPVQSSASMWFHLAKSSIVTITVFDTIGRNSVVLMDRKHFDSGAHKISLSFAGISSGSYLCMLDAEGQVVTKIVQVLP